MGNLAHALKTPLAIISNHTDQTQDKILRNQIDYIRKNIDRYLNKARSSATGNIVKSKIDVDIVTKKIIKIFRKIYPNLQINLISIDKNLLIPGNSDDLDEILGNLLENACKWTNEVVELKVLKFSDRSIKFTISDDGPGLPKHRRAEVFARGFRLDEQTPGTGLGLNIVKDTVEQYSGKVWLSESIFNGLEVNVILPISI